MRVQSLAAARDGGLWVSTSVGLYHLKDQKLELLQAGLPRSRGAYEDERGVLWIASSGLYRYADGQLTHYGAPEGFQDSLVHSVLPDSAGFLWLSTNVGVWRAPIAELDRYATGEHSAIGFERFAERHGMRNSETNGGSPNMVIGKDRHLWLATMGGVATVRVDELARKPRPLVARVERILVDGVAAPPASYASLGPDIGRLEIEYTAFEMRTPEAVVFRHRLLPLDQDWIPSQDARTASYRRLPPGHYTFEVQASLELLRFPGPVAAAEFTILPNWYEADWFRAAVLVLLVALAIGVPLIRIRALRKQEVRLQQEVAARTHDLGEANLKLDIAARTDVLTQVANRREFGERLAAALVADPGAGQLCLALCDIDHFKAYNDAYGHLAGDECLRAVAQALQTHLASRQALVARYGGEEFAVLLPHCGLAEAAALLESTRQAIGDLGLPHQASGVSAFVSISAGVAHLRPGGDARTLIDAADRALYSAKHLGRNRVEIAV
jgi:diguanylate cyclase (GGDEF)-like protein